MILIQVLHSEIWQCLKPAFVNCHVCHNHPNGFRKPAWGLDVRRRPEKSIVCIEYWGIRAVSEEGIGYMVLEVMESRPHKSDSSKDRFRLECNLSKRVLSSLTALSGKVLEPRRRCCHPHYLQRLLGNRRLYWSLPSTAGYWQWGVWPLLFLESVRSTKVREAGVIICQGLRQGFSISHHFE